MLWLNSFFRIALSGLVYLVYEFNQVYSFSNLIDSLLRHLYFHTIFPNIFLDKLFSFFAGISRLCTYLRIYSSRIHFISQNSGRILELIQQSVSQMMTSWLFFSHFWPLSKWASFLWGVWCSWEKTLKPITEIP
jgi:hypothetical protein